jgi:hypothetical protein
MSSIIMSPLSHAAVDAVNLCKQRHRSAVNFATVHECVFSSTGKFRHKAKIALLQSKGSHGENTILGCAVLPKLLFIFFSFLSYVYDYEMAITIPFART